MTCVTFPASLISMKTHNYFMTIIWYFSNELANSSYRFAFNFNGEVTTVFNIVQEHFL
jgi:hypothetical protein